MGFINAQEDFMGPMDPDRRERMETLRIWKMTEFLDLTTEQSTKFFPKLKEFKESIRSDQDKQRKIMIEIHKLVNDKDYKSSYADVKNYAKQLSELEKSIITKKEAFIIDTGDILTADQQMEYIIFERRFRSRLMKALYQHEGPGGPMKGRRKP
jgi:Spy/CpxP family protein refolding chaperone